MVTSTLHFSFGDVILYAVWVYSNVNVVEKLLGTVKVSYESGFASVRSNSACHLIELQGDASIGLRILYVYLKISRLLSWTS